MNHAVYLGREVLEGDPARLRRLLIDHTGCDRAAAALLQAVETARRDGAVSYGMLYPRSGAEPADPGWKMRFMYDEPLLPAGR